jgi:hypothetical protein
MSHDADVGFAWSGRREGEVGGERSEVRGRVRNRPSKINGEWAAGYSGRAAGVKIRQQIALCIGLAEGGG